MESKAMIGKPAIKVDGVKDKAKAEEVKAKVKPEPESKEVKPVVNPIPKAAVETPDETPTPKPEAKKPITPTLASLQEELHLLKRLVLEHNQQIIELQEMASRKRKPTSNGKVQIRDKETGNIYPSKNNCYKSLLKAGDLKDLIAKGMFGPDPEKNTFGWYALVRALPERFEEIKPTETPETTEDKLGKVEQADAEEKPNSVPEDK